MTDQKVSHATVTSADALTIFGYKFVSRLTNVISPNAVASLTALLVPVFCVFLRGKRKIVARNMQRVQPNLRGRSLRRVVRKSYQSYARYYVETFRLPGLQKKSIDAKISVEGFSHIENALEKGNGVILALPHLGGWEWSGRWLIHQGHKLHAVVEKLESQALFDMFVELRRSYGVDVIPLDERAGVMVQEALAKNEIVALLCDRDLLGNGIEVDFFGEQTTVPAGPAFFALRTGATILPLGTYFGRGLDQHETIVRPAIEIKRTGSLRQDMKNISQSLVNELEILIRRAPEQWHIFQPNWPSDKYSADTSN